MSTRNPKLALFAQFAAVAKCLAHPHRLELLEQLAQGERSVEVLAPRSSVLSAATLTIATAWSQLAVPNSCSDHGPAKLLFSMYDPKTSSLWAICLAL